MNAAIVSKEDAARIVLQMESCEVRCSHCGRINRIDGFSEIRAFICQHCGKGVELRID